MPLRAYYPIGLNVSIKDQRGAAGYVEGRGLDPYGNANRLVITPLTNWAHYQQVPDEEQALVGQGCLLRPAELSGSFPSANRLAMTVSVLIPSPVKWSLLLIFFQGTCPCYFVITGLARPSQLSSKPTGPDTLPRSRCCQGPGQTQGAPCRLGLHDAAQPTDSMFAVSWCSLIGLLQDKDVSDMPWGRPQICVAAVSQKPLPYNIIAFKNILKLKL
jgi:hypothetical protein